MRIVSGLYRFATASRAERKLIIAAAVLLLLFRGAVSIVSFRKLWRFLETSGRLEVRQPARQSLADPHQIALAVIRAARFVPKATCLVQSLAATVLFRRYGYPANLCIGVANDDGAFGAHAWVECDGVVAAGSKAHFTTLLVLPRAAPQAAATVPAIQQGGIV